VRNKHHYNSKKNKKKKSSSAQSIVYSSDLYNYYIESTVSNREVHQVAEHVFGKTYYISSKDM
jgi:hypothetical protein